MVFWLLRISPISNRNLLDSCCPSLVVEDTISWMVESEKPKVLDPFSHQPYQQEQNSPNAENKGWSRENKGSFVAGSWNRSEK